MKRGVIFLILLFRSLVFASLDDYTLDDKIERDRMRILQELRVTTLDPIKLSDIYSKRAFRYIYDTLFEIDEEGKVQPRLVKEYRYLDSKNLYIKLKDKIKFQDDSPLTSKDVKLSLLRVKEKGALKEFYKNIKDIKTINNLELIIELENEERFIFEILAHSMSSIVKEKDGKLLGTGEYIVDTFHKDDLILKKNKNFDEKIVIERVFSTKERMLALFNENADIVYDINDFDIARGKNLEIIDENKIEIKKSENIVTSALVFGEKRDLKFRKNIEGLLHEEAIYILPSEIYGKNFKTLEEKKDIKSIKKYISSFEKNQRRVEIMILNTEEDRALAKDIEMDLRKGGIDVKIVPYQVDAFYYKLKTKDFDVALQHLVFNKKFPNISLGKIILYDIYDKSLYDDFGLVEERLEIEEDSEKRRELYIEAINEISEKLPYIPIKHQPLYILSKKDIKG